MYAQQTLPLGAIVRTRTQQVGCVVAHNPNDARRVVVSVWSGWCWNAPRGFDVAALVVIEQQTVEQAA